MTTSAPPKLITWSDQYSVGIAAIDSQHQKLVAFINGLHAAMLSGQGSTVLGKTLDGLVGYTVTHFAFEEKLLRDSAYPELEAHRAEHAKLISSVSKLQQGFRSGTVAMSRDVMQFLKGWLMDHIVGVDKKYTSHMNACGVK